MIACIQRVSHASVTVGEDRCAEIGRGVLILLGVAVGDDARVADRLADKIAGLRIFDDDEGKMNLSLGDVAGAALVVSQFTLLGDARKGRRPSYAAAAPPDLAEALYERFAAQLRAGGVSVVTGRFRQHMRVALENDGPVTLILDTAQWT